MAIRIRCLTWDGERRDEKCIMEAFVILLRR